MMCAWGICHREGSQIIATDPQQPLGPFCPIHAKIAEQMVRDQQAAKDGTRFMGGKL